MTYRHESGRELCLHLFEPADFRADRPCGAFVIIHGGGWGGGTPRMMYPYAAWAAELGLIGISVEYRLYRPGNWPVAGCVKDVRAAVRFIRSHAAELGIDPSRIVVGGASAGGHLAAGTVLFDEADHANTDQMASCMPAALVLLSPVIDTSADGYGQAKLGDAWQTFSPLLRVRPGLPPTLLLHGTADTVTPYAGARDYTAAALAAGNVCELVTVDGAGHTYMFKDAARHEESRRQILDFLVRHRLGPHPVFEP